MSSIDKVIKQCFKDTKSYFMMVIFGGLFVALLLSFGFTALVAPIALIVMVVGIFKILAYLFYKSIFAEEATLYQMLPVSANEIVVSRVFVAVIAFLSFYITLLGSFSFGVIILFSDIDEMTFFDNLFLIAHDVGILAFVSYLIVYFMNILLEVVLIFTGVTIFNTSAKEKGFLRALTIIGIWVALKIMSSIFTSVLTLAAMGSTTTYYMAAIAMIASAAIVSGICCRYVKTRLENNLQL
ncbi:MAG: hypothetical protein IKT62_01655 [Firmicutes bacterium]|nr:hypothetical protein [Bacillota bacterium]